MVVLGGKDQTSTASARLNRSRRVRLAGLVVGMVLVMTGCVVPRIPGSSASAMTSDQTHAYDLVNATRAQYGLRGLAIDWDARSKAQSWAQHLASIGYLKHSNLASGIGGTWVAIGENVGFGGSIQAVHNAYMNSPPTGRTSWRAGGPGWAPASPTRAGSPTQSWYSSSADPTTSDHRRRRQVSGADQRSFAGSGLAGSPKD